MTYTQYLQLILNATEFDDEDRFKGEVGYPADISLSESKYIQALHTIYCVAHNDFDSMVNGLKQIQLVKRLGIPQNQLSQWMSGKNSPSKTTLKMMGYCLIMSDRQGE